MITAAAHIDLFEREHGAEDAKVDVVQATVVPNLLGQDKCREEDGSPAGDENGAVADCD